MKEEGEQIILESKRFGKITVTKNRIIAFSDGLLGFEFLHQFFLADDPVDGELPFKWLISVEDPEISFLVTDPGIFFKDYVFDLSEEGKQKIGAETEEDISVLTILTVPLDPHEITANLVGPLVVNWKTFIGKQVILKNTAYTIKHYIFTRPQNPSQNLSKVQLIESIPEETKTS